MSTKFFTALTTGLLLFGSVAIAQAAQSELVPVSYTFDRATDSGSYTYADWTGHQLTDGKYGVAPWYADLGSGPAYEWVGWLWDSPVNVDFNLGSSVKINEIKIGTVQDVTWDVVLPSVRLYSSNDGSNWTQFSDYFVPESGANDNQYFTYDFANLNVNSQFFRVSLYHSYDGPWTFTDEIDFYTNTGAPLPVSATVVLFASGIAGIAGRIKKRKASV